jgi:hypothetical protein
MSVSEIWILLKMLIPADSIGSRVTPSKGLTSKLWFIIHVDLSIIFLVGTHTLTESDKEE